MATRTGAVGNLPWVRGTTGPSQILKTPRGAQHKEAITAELIAEATKIGGKQFIQKYGLATWTAINSIDTQNQELEKNIKDIDEGKEEEPIRGIGDNNPPSAIDDDSPPPEEEPPEDPDIDTDETIAQTKKLLDKREIKDELSDEEWDFLDDAMRYGKDLPKQIKNKVDKLLTNKKTTFTKKQYTKLITALDSYNMGNIYATQEAPESPHTDYKDSLDWDDLYGGGKYEDGFFQKENEYENLKVKLKKITNLPKNETWKPEALEFKDIIEQTDKLIKK